MALVDCGKGHIFDDSLYSACPYCSGKNKVVDYTQRGSGGGTVMPGMNGGGSGGARTVAPGGYSGSSGGGTVMPGMNGGGSGGGRTVAPGGYSNGSENGGTVAPEWYKRQQKQDQKNQRDGKTVAPDWLIHSPNDESRQDSNAVSSSFPVVGWLVCIEGSNRGTDFRLRAKINTIGRELSNDVSVHGDNAISRENHVSIAYDPKHNQFHILPGNGTTSSAYVNSEPVYTPVKLQSHDKIELGNSTFLFIPFCDDQFNWNTGTQEKSG